MKIKHLSKLCVPVLFLVFSQPVHATVGGATSILRSACLKNNEIYIQIHHKGGRAGSEILKGNPQKETITPFYGIDEQENKFRTIGYEEEKKYYASLIPDNCIELKEVNLQKLGAKVNFEMMLREEDFVRYQDMMPGFNTSWKWRGEFLIKGELRRIFEIDECVQYGENVNVRGYGLPNDNFLLLVLTYMRDCSEYGYFSEDMILLNKIHTQNQFFLPEIHNPISPKGKEVDEFCCPTGTKVFPSPGGLYPHILHTYKMMNNLGFAEYKKENYQEAISLFQQAISMSLEETSCGLDNIYSADFCKSEDIVYMMPIFNLASTLSKVGSYEQAILISNTILASGDTTYIKKVFQDSDF